MEYLNRETRDVPFGWMEALMSLLHRKSEPRREPLRLPPPASAVPSAR